MADRRAGRAGHADDLRWSLIVLGEEKVAGRAGRPGPAGEDEHELSAPGTRRHLQVVPRQHQTWLEQLLAARHQRDLAAHGRTCPGCLLADGQGVGP